MVPAGSSACKLPSFWVVKVVVVVVGRAGGSGGFPGCGYSLGTAVQRNDILHADHDELTAS